MEEAEKGHCGDSAYVAAEIDSESDCESEGEVEDENRSESEERDEEEIEVEGNGDGEESNNGKEKEAEKEAVLISFLDDDNTTTLHLVELSASEIKALLDMKSTNGAEGPEDVAEALGVDYDDLEEFLEKRRVQELGNIGAAGFTLKVPVRFFFQVYECP